MSVNYCQVRRRRLRNQILATTALRGAAYEGFYRSTRPYSQIPGRFIHDQIMIRLNADGLLGFDMVTAGVRVEGYALTLQHRVFVICSELTSGSLGFGIFNGAASSKVGVLDGLGLNCALDAVGTPTAAPMVIHRIGDLSGDREADDARFAVQGGQVALAPEGSVPKVLADRLLRDIGPAQAALGGEMLLQATQTRSLAAALPGWTV